MIGADGLAQAHQLLDGADAVRIGIANALRGLDHGAVTRNDRQIDVVLIACNVNDVQCHDFSLQRMGHPD